MSTEIEWTDETWNPVTGCTKVSPGCAHCYAEAVADRFWATQYPSVVTPTVEGASARPREFTDVQTHADRLDQPLRWKLPRRIFVNSMSDLFHEAVPDQFLHDVYHVMEHARQHTFQILTKRAKRMHQYLNWRYGPDEDNPRGRIPSRHLWHGVSVENQRLADERIPLLLQTPSAVRFLSCEPLLEGLDLAKHRPGALGLHWCIVCGESGSGARPCDTRWVRNIVRQCQEADVAVFVKQLGANVRDRNDAGFEGDTPRSWPMDTDVEDYPNGYREDYQGAQVRVRLTNRKGGDMVEWPKDLRVREFPT